MKKVIGFITAFVIVILVWIIFNLRPLNSSQYCTEKVKIENNRHYYVVHKAECPEYKAFLKNRLNIIDFKKHVYDRYCPFCFEQEDILLFDSISSYNIQQFDNYDAFIIDYEDMQQYMKYRDCLDNSTRGYDLYYVYDDLQNKFIKISTDK